MAKDCHRVAFPVMLDMTPYAVQTENRYPSQLTAVISHMGNPENDQGYYMTFLRIFGQSIRFNDTEVEAVKSVGCVVQPLFVAATLEIDAQAMFQIEEDKILNAFKLTRVFSNPMRASITNPPQFEGSDHADEYAALFDRSPFARRLNRTSWSEAVPSSCAAVDISALYGEVTTPQSSSTDSVITVDSFWYSSERCSNRYEPKPDPVPPPSEFSTKNESR
jgi:hypothetical protein